MSPDLQLPVSSLVKTKWRLDDTPETFEQAKALAPRLAVDPTKPDWFASDPVRWLGNASLRWRNSASDLQPVSAPVVDVDGLGLQAADAFHYGDPPVACTSLTRPFQGPGEIRNGLPRKQGFVLQVPTNSAELAKQPAPAPDAPYFVESWELLNDERRVHIHIYWMFNAASGLDGRYALFHLLKHRIALLKVGHILGRGDLAEAPAMELAQEELVGHVEGYVFDEFQYVHEGDWEGISVVVCNGSPLGAQFRTHHEGDWRPWSSACDASRWNPDFSDRPLAQMAPLSHACYPPDRTESDDDPLPGPTESTQYFDMAQTLRQAPAQAWYGFGGAWGAPRLRDFFDDESSPINPADELTGPLGPCLTRAGIELARVWSSASAKL